MPSRSIDNAVRVLLGAAGIISVVLFFVLHDATRDWAATPRLLAAIPLTAMVVYGLAAVSELRDKYEERDLLQFRRLGRRRIGISNNGSFSSRKVVRPVALTHATAEQFRCRIGNSLIALGIGMLVTLPAWFGSLDALRRTDDLSEGLILWVLALPLGLYIASRSLIRIIMAGRAVKASASGITLGIPLGFSWPVRISFEDIALILILETNPGPEYLILTTSDRSYHVDGRHLKNGSGLRDWIDRHVANATVAEVRETAFEEPEPTLTRPIATPPGAGPPLESIELARRALNRRTRRLAVLLAVGIVFAGANAWAYANLRAENHQLETSGTRYEAEVFKVVGSSRGAPGELHVRFEEEETRIERIIYSDWFHEFDGDLKGESIVVLFDPSTEGIAKRPGQANYPTWLGFGVLAAIVLLLLGALGFWGSRKQPAVLDKTNWERVRISMGSNTNAPLLLRRTQDDRDHLLRGVWGRGKATFENQDAWLATDGRNIAVLPNDSGRVLTTTVGKQSALRENVAQRPPH